MRTDSWKCPTGDDRTWMFYDSGGASNKHNYVTVRAETNNAIDATLAL